MSFYPYNKKFIPLLPYIKDSLLLSIFPLLLLLIVASSYKIKKLNYLDKIIFFLFSYLLIQFLRTGLELSFAASYSGFRLTFMYILLYFLYRSISSYKILCTIDKIFYIILNIALIITLSEAIFIKTGIVSIDTLGKLMVLNRYPFQEYNRVYGITGSIHITGVYNCIFFVMLLFGLHLNRNKNKYRGIFFIEKIQSIKSRRLLILSFLSVIVSRSQTAWTCMAVLLLLYSFSGKIITLRKVIKILSIISFGVFFPFIYFGDDIYGSYISFAVTYFGRIVQDIAPLFDSILFGSGYHVSQTAVGVDWSVLKKNTLIFTDFFFLDIFSALGLIGILFYFLLFGLIPFYIIISNKYSYEYKIIAAPILVVGIAFGHYNPLQSTNINAIIWYLFAQLSNMLQQK